MRNRSKQQFKFKGISIIIAICFVFAACVKINGTTQSDGIVSNGILGKYSGSLTSQPGGPVPVQVEVYKTEFNKYGLKKLTTSGFPDFVFETDTSKLAVGLILGLEYFIVCSPTVGAPILSDSGWVAYKNSDKVLEFELKNISSGSITRFYGKELQ